VVRSESNLDDSIQKARAEEEKRSKEKLDREYSQFYRRQQGVRQLSFVDIITTDSLVKKEFSESLLDSTSPAPRQYSPGDETNVGFYSKPDENVIHAVLDCCQAVKMRRRFRKNSDRPKIIEDLNSDSETDTDLESAVSSECEEVEVDEEDDDDGNDSPDSVSY